VGASPPIAPTKGVPMVPMYRSFVAKLAGLASAAVATVAAAAGPACDADLSPAQRDRFELAAGGCNAPTEPPTASPAMHADALVASASRPSAVSPTLAPEAAHLQLFGRPGVVMARIGDPVEAGALGPRRASTRSAPRALQLAPQVDAVARRHDIDPLLLHAIAYVESRHNPAARSPAGARGVMQVMPATGARFGVAQPDTLHHAGTNLEVSASYLKELQQRFGTDLRLVLAAYNAGEGAVERYGRRVPPFAETQNYVNRVLDHYRALTAAARRAAAASLL
jgi:soluble lytic murein transglycosylase-like protein